MPEVLLETGHAPGRALVRLRVPMSAAAQAAAALGLPVEPLSSCGEAPSALWIAPDQWLLIDETASASNIIEDVRCRLGTVLHSATDASDAFACFMVSGSAARGLLAMASGVDFDTRSFGPGQCVRTRFAKLAVLIRALEADHFELFFDSSAADYLERWLRRAMADATA